MSSPRPLLFPCPDCGAPVKVLARKGSPSTALCRKCGLEFAIPEPRLREIDSASAKKGRASVWVVLVVLLLVILFAIRYVLFVI
jgi:hypothetical protein